LLICGSGFGFVNLEVKYKCSVSVRHIQIRVVRFLAKAALEGTIITPEIIWSST
jgi:hypothetical protein